MADQVGHGNYEQMENGGGGGGGGPGGFPGGQGGGSEGFRRDSMRLPVAAVPAVPVDRWTSKTSSAISSAAGSRARRHPDDAQSDARGGEERTSRTVRVRRRGDSGSSRG